MSEDGPDVRIRRESVCREHRWEAIVTGSDEARVTAEFDRAQRDHWVGSHEGQPALIVVVESSDPPLPRYIGLFDDDEHAERHMADLIGGGTASWNTAPLVSQWHLENGVTP